MERPSKRIVAIGAALALAVAGGGAAYAATSGGDPGEALLRDAAQRLNVEPSELRSALEGAFGDQLDEAVKDGRLTQRQADQIKQQVREHGLPLGGPMGGERHFMVGPGPFKLDAAADYLGLTRAQLDRQLRNRRSLAQIARAQGKSIDGLEQALLAAATTDLDRAVADGRLTAAQRDEIVERLREHIGDIVAGKGPGPGGPGGPGGRHEHHHELRGGPGFGMGAPDGPPPPLPPRSDDEDTD
jgi:hypothetical protein